MVRIGLAAAHALMIAMLLVFAGPVGARAQSEKDVEALNGRIIELYKQGKFAEAIPAAEGTVMAAEFALGKDHPVTLTSVSNLAALYRAQGRYAEAEPLYKRALAGFERVPGPDHPDTLRIAGDLAAMYADEGLYDAAAALYKRAGEAKERILGKEHADTLKTLMTLGFLYWKQGRYGEAGDIYARVLEPAERVFGKDNPEFTALLNNDALLRFSLRDWPGAAEVLRRNAAAIGSRALRGDEGGGQQPAGKEKSGAGQNSAFPMLVKALYRLAPEGHMPDAAASRESFEAAQWMLGPAASQMAAPLSVEDVQSRLEPDEALALFLDTGAVEPTPEETFIWVVTKTDLRWVRSGWGTAALTREVQALRCGLDTAAWDGPRCTQLTGQTYTGADREAGKPPPFDHARAHKLYLSLFGQVEDLIKGKTLLLAPSGPLSQLPFKSLVTALPDGAGDNPTAWLSRDHALTVLPAVSSLTARGGAAPAPQPSQ
jgi:tetratricopeptide (TPR) repeat protein